MTTNLPRANAQNAARACRPSGWTIAFQVRNDFFVRSMEKPAASGKHARAITGVIVQVPTILNRDGRATCALRRATKHGLWTSRK